MYDTKKPSAARLNLETYRDKLFGCWMGKNIGGTLGAPFENTRTTYRITGYTQELNGEPVPNDDLDLQLIWLIAAEAHSAEGLTEQILSEYWMTYVAGISNEYGVCKGNIAVGLLPPLSGACNNERWKWSNGAWIRSEIWAALFPGSPDEVAVAAWKDACCDHEGEGIYAEIFTAVMESMAYVIDDVGQLIEWGLSRIPETCRVARSVRLACECHRNQEEFFEARERLVKDSEDLGWMQAPCNLGFVVLALLYGEGDFGRSICMAVNCGDDTDCTAATVGALLGICHGRATIPEKWTVPIGERIGTCTLHTFPMNYQSPLPKTVPELVDRVEILAGKTALLNRTLVQFHSGPSDIPPEYLGSLKSNQFAERRLWPRSSAELTFRFAWGEIRAEYDKDARIVPGIPKKILLKVSVGLAGQEVVVIRPRLPEGWRANAAGDWVFRTQFWDTPQMPLELTATPHTGAFFQLPLEVCRVGRMNREMIFLPLQFDEMAQCEVHYNPRFFDLGNQLSAECDYYRCRK